jgi:hypothetical protein
MSTTTTLSKKHELKLSNFIGSGATMVHAKGSSQASFLKLGSKRLRLTTETGALTEGGKAYQAHLGRELPPHGFDMNQTPIRTGNVETIRMRDGTQKTVRRWNSAGVFKYTGMGNRFFSNQQEEAVVQIPIIRKGPSRNEKGSYEIFELAPVAKFGFGNALTTPNDKKRDEKIKAQILAGFDVPLVKGGKAPDYKNHPIWTESTEKTYYNPEGEWRIVVLMTTPGKPPKTHVIKRALGAKPLSASDLPFPEAICDEAFVFADDKLCCARQISAILGVDFAEVRLDLNRISAELRHMMCGRADRICTEETIIAYAKEKGLGCGFIHKNQMRYKALPEEAGAKSLVFVVLDEHAYFYKLKIAKLLRWELGGDEQQQQQQISRAPDLTKAAPAYRTWEPWRGVFQPGHYHTTALRAAYLDFLESGRSPRLSMKSSAALLKKLTYVCTAKDLYAKRGAEIVVHETPDLVAAAFMEHFGLAYRGESLPSATHRVMCAAVKVPRRAPTAQEKARLGRVCVLCGDTPDQVEYDHVYPLHSSGGFDQTVQPMCVPCHSAKTAESKAPPTDVLRSHFRTEVAKKYVESPLHPAIKHVPQRMCCGGMMHADIEKCHRSALYKNTYPVPVFGPLDAILPVNGELGDMLFVTRRFDDCVKDLAYPGPGWYHRQYVEFLMDHGVLSWNDLQYKLTATAHLPADVFRKPIDDMLEYWGPDLDNAKRSINAMIGIWGIVESFVWSTTSSPHPFDAPDLPNVYESQVSYSGGVMFNFMRRTKLLETSSYRPLHDLVKGYAAVALGRMLFCLRKKTTICEINTDGILYRPNLKNAKMIELGEGIRHHPAEPHDYMGYSCEQASREPWRVEFEPMVWRDVSAPQARHLVQTGQRLFVQGLAGTGKTHFVHREVEKLRAAGRRADVISKMHANCDRIGLKGTATADHWVNKFVRNGSVKCEDLWIDEVSQLDHNLLLDFNTVSPRFLLSGDFNQFGPISNSFRGTEVPAAAFENSKLLWEMAGGNRLTLTECRRSSRQLFDFYSTLIRGERRFDISDARARYPLLAGAGPTLHNLVISHKQRIRINAELNRLHAPAADAVVEVTFTEEEKGFHNNEPQDMLVYPGLMLLGCSTFGEIKNAVPYTVVEVYENEVLVKDESEAEFLVPWAVAKKVLRLGFARTYASIQGTEYKEPLTLHDAEHRFFTRQHLYVGLSRARGGVYIK